MKKMPNNQNFFGRTDRVLFLDGRFGAIFWMDGAGAVCARTVYDTLLLCLRLGKIFLW